MKTEKSKLKVLFVSSSNSNNFEIAPFIKAQGESLEKEGVELQYFPVKGKGIRGYLKSAIRLRKFLKNSQIDIIHAHYTLCGWTAVLALPKIPIVLSLMGSDAYGEYIGEGKIKFSSRILIILTYLIQPFVKQIICKSKHIEGFVYLKNKSSVVANGIIFDKIPIIDDEFRVDLNLHRDKKYVLFLGNKDEIRKNFDAVEKATECLKSDDIELIAPYPVSHEQVFKYLNSVDVLVVPSFMEGSPNVVKEAMACNCPVVATNVGDVEWLFGDEPGYFVSNFEPEDIAEKINKAIEFKSKFKKTKGRDRLMQLGLSSEAVATKIIEIYKNKVLHENYN